MAWQDRSQPKDAQYHHTGGWQTSPRAQNRHIGQDAIEAERSALRESQEQPPSDEDDGDDDDDMSHSELEDIAEDGSSSQTALDARAQRRKMKRFRLTHNQTRYLMAEFARQPHPDAAQRERLSREIPGLSSRQVQVWFQNRRAKLKRLTAPDRERMMRSRALPDDFNRATTLRSTFFKANLTNINTAMTPPSESIESTRILTSAPVLSHRRDLNGETSTSSVPSSFSEHIWSAGSGPTSQLNSPTSPVDDRNPYRSILTSHIHGSYQATPSARSQSIPALYGSRSLHLPTRIRAGSLASPPSAQFPQSAPLRHSISEVSKALIAPADSPHPGFPKDFQLKPSLNSTVGYSSLEGHSISQSRPLSAIEYNSRASYNASFYATSAYSSLPTTQPQQPSAGDLPTFQQYQQAQSACNPSATALTSCAWSPGDQAAGPLPSISYPTPYTCQVPYNTYEGTGENSKKNEETENRVNGAIIGLGLPQHVFASRQAGVDSGGGRVSRSMECERQG